MSARRLILPLVLWTEGAGFCAGITAAALAESHWSAVGWFGASAALAMIGMARAKGRLDRALGPWS